jgi:hypothetical protein
MKITQTLKFTPQIQSFDIESITRPDLFLDSEAQEITNNDTQEVTRLINEL